MIAFKVLDPSERALVGHSRLKVHLVFDIKLDFAKKARLVASGHLTPDPVNSIYAGVVSRETVQIALTYAALHGIDLWAAHVFNAFVQVPTTEKYHIECGPEFGYETIGKRAVVTRALYGIKSSARTVRNHLRDCMDNMGFKCPYLIIINRQFMNIDS